MPCDKDDLNARLIAQQELSTSEVDKICKLHDRRVELFAQMQAMNPNEDMLRLHIAADAITQIEFDLQALWGFEQSMKYHCWWYQAPHCICPILDNNDAIGTNKYYYDDNCPLHGGSQWKYDRGLSIQQVRYQISPIMPSSLEISNVTLWKDCYNLLNGKIRAFKQICVNWWES